jgi:hypothetical protein
MNLVDTLVASFNQVVNDLVTALPAVIGALLILLIGWIIARVVSGAVRGLLRRTGVDKSFAERGTEVYGDRTSDLAPSSLAGTATFWIIILVALIAATNFLNWPQVSALLNDFLAWLPNLIIAVIILLAAPIVARLVRSFVETGSSGMGMTTGRTLGRLAEVAIIGIAVVVAVNQVGIATDLINIVLIGLVAAMAIAVGLAFGLGGREVAAQVTQGWYNSARSASASAQRSAATAPTAPAPAPAAPPARPADTEPARGS